MPGSTTVRSDTTSRLASDQVVPWAKWDFRSGRPGSWTTLPGAEVTSNPDGLDVRTTAGETDYQLMSDPIVLSRGDYSVRMTAATRFGGIEVGLLDAAANQWMKTAFYASSQGTATRTIALPFALTARRTIRIVLCNWMPGQGRSLWHLTNLRIQKGSAIPSPQAQVNAVSLPAAGIASFAATPLAEIPLPPELARLVPAAIADMHGPGSTWAKATQIRTLVRDAMPPDSTCSQVATAYWKLGTHAGLAIRLVQGTANGTNLYDSHETTSVWLPEERRWAITDPTFNGFWSVGPSSVPIGVATLRQYLRAGREDKIYWHQTLSRNAIRPSSYYVDPLALYRYAGVQASVQGAEVFLVWDPTFVRWGTYLMPHAAIENVPPAHPVPVTKVAAAPGSTSSFSMPPPYLGRRIVERRLAVGSNGRGRVTLGWPGIAAVTVPAQAGRWVLDQPDGTQFPLSSIGGGELSPIVTLVRGSTVSVTGAAPGTYLVHVWIPKRFPKARELQS